MQLDEILAVMGLAKLADGVIGISAKVYDMPGKCKLCDQSRFLFT
jgi:hypothetical protein